MKIGACTCERELADLLARGHWPQAASEELRAHVTSCRSCGDLVLVTTAFRSDRTRQSALPRLEAPGVLWWRAQLRRRQQALQQIGRPLLGAQIFAVAVTLLAAFLFLLAQGKQGIAQLSGIADLPRSLHLEHLLPDALQKSQTETWLVVSATLVMAVAGGILVYVKSEQR